MNETQQVLRKLADASAYDPDGNPTDTDLAIGRLERVLAPFFLASTAVLAILFVVQSADPGGFGSRLATVVVIAGGAGILSGLGYMLADVIVRRVRKRFRADDEFHHTSARACHRELQVEALVVHNDGVLEDMADQIEARLTGASTRLSAVIGDRSSIITTGVALIAAYKVATDLKWVPAGSAYSLFYLVVGAFIVLTPAMLGSAAERLVYQKGLLASARKRKARALLDGGQPAVPDLAAGLTPLPAAANDGDGTPVSTLLGTGLRNTVGHEAETDSIR
ncbi:hypothetical protein [Luteibacter sp. ME-Dv--P-043b]|uniref:hypothetical protein n=1 Tax=Luteibacter sp. ME-Dv--P-043b TaxID=3040291 RepID=UPI0025554BAD|nr:hypothetical protein [Luteibacter sp. ME-Dv--P-043b]